MTETKQFNRSATGLAVVDAIPYRLIKAKYPLAPPCPTAEYKQAIAKSKIYTMRE